MIKYLRMKATYLADSTLETMTFETIATSPKSEQYGVATCNSADPTSPRLSVSACSLVQDPAKYKWFRVQKIVKIERVYLNTLTAIVSCYFAEI